MRYNPRIIGSNDGILKSEMQQIGVAPSGIDLMLPKGTEKILKLENVPSTAANIIKQQMLSLGGEAAVAYGVVNHAVKKTGVLLMGTEKVLEMAAKKLDQPWFDLPKIATEIKIALKEYKTSPSPIKVKNLKLDFGKRTYIMGIVNVTPDSFSDGGKFLAVDDAVEQAKQMIKEGADLIDIGGQSTRPGARKITLNEELKRVIPVIKEIKKKTKIPISIDTTKAKVAEKALAAGADMVNDISGLRADPQMAKVIAKHKIPAVVMHIQGAPQTMQKNPRYNDLMGEIIAYLRKCLDIAANAGIKRDLLIVDPGFGFGKTLEHNFEILRRLKELKVLGRPILVGTSRKSMIGKVLDLSAEERVEGTAATVALAINNGADIIRVHDVSEMAKVAKMSDAIVRCSERYL